MNKSYILILTFFLTLVCKNALPETESGNSWLTGFHSDSSLRFFFNQDDGLEEDRYLTEGIVSLEYIIFSKDQNLSQKTFRSRLLKHATI